MTVAELIEELQKMPQDKECYICGTCPSGENDFIEPSVYLYWDNSVVIVGSS